MLGVAQLETKGYNTGAPRCKWHPDDSPECNIKICSNMVAVRHCRKQEMFYHHNELHGAQSKTRCS